MKNTLVIAVGISTTLILLVMLQHNLSFQKTGTIVLPAGGTYLGPPSISPSSPPLPSLPSSGFTTMKGRKYPYSFEAPATIKFVTFPNDAFDIYAISLPDQPPENNVLIGVDNLNRTDDLKQYIKGNKRAYVENWWKQFGALKGVISITEFTNSKGLKGYKAKFVNGSSDDIFFETSNPDNVIHLANGPLDKKIFNAIVDSVAWEK